MLMFSTLHLLLLMILLLIKQMFQLLPVITLERIPQSDRAHLQRLEVTATYQHKYARAQAPVRSSAVTETTHHKTSTSFYLLIFLSSLNTKLSICIQSLLL